MNTVLTALNILRTKFNLSSQPITEGLTHVTELTGLRGRWEQLRTQPTVICDTGHNVGGWQYLAPQIAAQPCRHRRIVFGMVDDKDIDTVMHLLPRDAVYYWVQPTSKRAFPADKVTEEAERAGLKGRNCGSVANGYRQALADATPDDFIFVGGSSYVVADLLALNDF